MKKIIAVLLAILTMASLSVAAFASGSAEVSAAEAVTKTEAVPAEDEADAVRTHGKGASEEIEAAVSKEDAVAAALKDAGFAEDEVTVTRTRLREKEDENGETVTVYTVKFHTEDTTYKYHVDANTGEIIDSTVTEGVSDGHADKASGEMGASGELSEDDETVTESTRDRRNGGHKSAAAESAASDVLTDVNGV